MIIQLYYYRLHPNAIDLKFTDPQQTLVFGWLGPFYHVSIAMQHSTHGAPSSDVQVLANMCQHAVLICVMEGAHLTLVFLAPTWSI